MSLTYIAILVITALLFLILLVLLAFRPGVIARLNGIFLGFSAAAGIILYGYGYYMVYSNIIDSIIHTLFSVIRMFLGNNSIDDLAAVPLFQTDGMITFFYLFHMMATYSAISAVIAALGKRVLRRMNLLLVQRGTLHLIYGTSWESVEFGLKLQKMKRNATAFIDTGNGSSYDEDILRAGSLLVSDENAFNPSVSLLKWLGIRPGRRRVSLYCLEADPQDNYRFAVKMMQTFAEAGIKPEQISLSLLIDDESKGALLQAKKGEDKGFGSVFAIERENILARAMIKAAPPYQTMTFDETGAAQDDFHVLITGFDKTGQAALRTLVMNGQFAGSRFRASIIDPDHLSKAGYFYQNYPEILKQYDLDFLNADAVSVDAYQYVEKLGKSLNYVVICTGNSSKNEEVARGYAELLAKEGCAVPVMLFSGSTVRRFGFEGTEHEKSLFSTELLCLEKLDTMAMMLNHKYHEKEGNTAAEDWKQCDYFSRRSCRASADYTDAFLCAAGLTGKEVLEGKWDLSKEQLESLSRSEHERWCAFHYAMGFQKMPDDIYDSRAEEYKKQIAQGTAPLRIGKDMEKKQHACLIPWEELDALSAKESAITGKPIDYKQLDRDNVELIPELLAKTAAQE